jgi:O-antigen ligase
LDQKFFIKYSYYILAIFFFIFFDLIFQKIYKYDIFGFVAEGSNIDRLTGPFGNKEYIPASYIYHICLPFILYILFNNFINNKLINYFISILVFISLVVSIFITGERIIFIMLLATIFFNFFFYKNFLVKFLFAGLLCFFLIYFISSFDGYYKDRYSKFINIISGTKEKNTSFLDSQWGAHYLTSIQIFKNNFFFGKGARSFRVECSNSLYEMISSASKDIRCSTHPHNFYLEILSETGVFGIILFFIIVYKFLIILIEVIKKNFFNIRNLNYNIAMVHVIPTLVLLFPIKSSGAIFSNLYGLMFWSLFAFSYGFLLKTKNTHKKLF